MANRVVITGMGVVSPIGNDVETFWNSLKENKRGFGEITYFDTFDAEKYADESEIDGEYAELVNKKIEEADKAYEESQKKNYA